MNIGDIVQGGVLFYSGTTVLIAALKDIKISLYWGAYGVAVSGTSTTLGTGDVNTANMISLSTGNTMFAANACVNYTYSGLTDWYLPSSEELNELYLVKDIVGGFDEYTNYWTSSQNTPQTAWIQYFGPGIQSKLGGKEQLYKVRPIRTYIP